MRQFDLEILCRLLCASSVRFRSINALFHTPPSIMHGTHFLFIYYFDLCCPTYTRAERGLHTKTKTISRIRKLTLCVIVVRSNYSSLKLWKFNHNQAAATQNLRPTSRLFHSFLCINYVTNQTSHSHRATVGGFRSVILNIVQSAKLYLPEINRTIQYNQHSFVFAKI